MNVLKKIEYLFFPCQRKLDEAHHKNKCALKQLQRKINILKAQIYLVQKSQ